DAIYDLYPQRLLATGGRADEHFGHSLSLSGNILLVGAPDANSAAHVFVMNGTTWSEQVKLIASDTASGIGFGSAAAWWGPSGVLRAPGADALSVERLSHAYRADGSCSRDPSTSPACTCALSTHGGTKPFWPVGICTDLSYGSCANTTVAIGDCVA